MLPVSLEELVVLLSADSQGVAEAPVAVEEQAAVLVVRAVVVPDAPAAEHAAAVRVAVVVAHVRVRAEVAVSCAPVAEAAV